MIIISSQQLKWPLDSVQIITAGAWKPTFCPVIPWPAYCSECTQWHCPVHDCCGYYDWPGHCSSWTWWKKKGVGCWPLLHCSTCPQHCVLSFPKFEIKIVMIFQTKNFKHLLLVFFLKELLKCSYMNLEKNMDNSLIESYDSDRHRSTLK